MKRETYVLETRMHSSRMRTARSSSRPGGLHQAPPGTRHIPRDQASRPCGQTHTCKHITLPQTSFASGKKEESLEWTPFPLEGGTLPEVEDVFCNRDGFRIPCRGSANPSGGKHDFAKMFQKSHEIEKNLVLLGTTGRGRGEGRVQ